MDTNATIRHQVLTLVRLGISQKVLAREMGLTESWLSRWLVARAGKERYLSTYAMDRLADYLVRLLEAIQHSATTPMSADVVAFMDVVKQVDASHRPLATRTLQEIVRHQQPAVSPKPADRASGKQSTPPHRETSRAPQATSAKRVVAGGRNRRL